MKDRFWKLFHPAQARERDRQVRNYAEGRRLMRHGDGYDERVGNRIAFEAREALRTMGYDIDGTRPDLTRLTYADREGKVVRRV